TNTAMARTSDPRRAPVDQRTSIARLERRRSPMFGASVPRLLLQNSLDVRRCAYRLSTLKRPGVLAPRLERAVPNALATIIPPPCARIFPANGYGALPSDVAILPSGHIESPT